MDEVGSPWPNASYGEVVGPSAVRSYRIATAAALSRKSDRTVRNLASAHPGLVVRARIPGLQGPAVLFLDAASFEAIGQVEGWWPPSESVVALATGGTQGLASAVRERIVRLEKRVSFLEHQLSEARAENDDLLRAVETLTRIARHKPG